MKKCFIFTFSILMLLALSSKIMAQSPQSQWFNVSPSSGSSSNQGTLDVDIVQNESTGHTYVAYSSRVGSTTYDIVFREWTGSSWSPPTVIESNCEVATGSGESPSISIELFPAQTDIPIVIYSRYDSGSDKTTITSASRQNGSWTTKDLLDITGSVPATAIDASSSKSSSEIEIAYIHNAVVNHVVWDGSNITVNPSIINANISQISIATGTDGSSHIVTVNKAIQQNTNVNELVYISKPNSSANWTAQIFWNFNIEMYSPWIDLDSNNNEGIAFFDKTARTVRYMNGFTSIPGDIFTASKTNSGDPTVIEGVEDMSLRIAFDQSNTPNVSYMGRTTVEVENPPPPPLGPKSLFFSKAINLPQDTNNQQWDIKTATKPCDDNTVIGDELPFRYHAMVIDSQDNPNVIQNFSKVISGNYHQATKFVAWKEPIPRSLALDLSSGYYHADLDIDENQQYPVYCAFVEDSGKYNINIRGYDGSWDTFYEKQSSYGSDYAKACRVDYFSDSQISAIYYDKITDTLTYLQGPRDSVGWVSEIITTNGGQHNSLVVDSQGVPHVAYTEGSNLYYAERIGPNNWSNKLVDTSAGQYNSMAIDDVNNVIAISYFKSSNLGYAENINGGGWNVSTVPNTSGMGWDTSIDLDSNGKPFISFYDYVSSNLMLANRPASQWTVTNLVGTSTGVSAGETSTLKLNGDDRWKISYYHNTLDKLVFMQEEPVAGSGTHSCIEGEAGIGSSMDLDMHGNMRATYKRKGTNQRFYITLP